MDMTSKDKQGLQNIFAQDSEKILYGFLANLKSPHTKLAYKKDLENWAQFLREVFPKENFLSVDYEHLVAYRNHLEKRGNRDRSGPAQAPTINRAVACLKKFYRHLNQRGLIKHNPTNLLDPVAMDLQVKTPSLTLEQWEALMQVGEDQSLVASLHRAIVTMLFTTGMRKSELTNLKLGNLHHRNGSWFLEYFAKGKKRMIKPLNKICTQALMVYLKYCRDNDLTMGENDYLFRPTRNRTEKCDNNKKLQGTSVDFIVKKFCDMANIAKEGIRTHTSRATVITLLYEKGFDLKQIKDFVGHSHLNMTLEYIKSAERFNNEASHGLDI